MKFSNVNEFKNNILHKFFAALHQSVSDNFDAQRFNFDGEDRSDIFFIDMHITYLDNFFQNLNAIYQAYESLESESSKSVYIDVLIYKLVGHHHYIINSSIRRRKKQNEEFISFSEQYAKPSQLQVGGMFGNLVHYDFEWQGKRYVLDCLPMGLMTTLSNGQYFYECDGIVIAPEEGDFVIDGGACLGDTALVFSNAVGATGHVYSFDPVADNLQVLMANVANFPLKNVTIYPCGLSDENINAEPIVLNSYAPGFSSEHTTSAHNILLPLRSLDFLVTCKDVERVDFIKLDVEGSEMATLRGAKHIISTFKPKLAISLYHKPNDFFEIINYIKTHYPFYKMYFDHYTIHQEESVLYCIA